MGSSITIVNNTPDTWQCKISSDENTVSLVKLCLSAVQIISTVIGTGVGAGGAMTVSGVATNVLEDIAPVIAADATNATIIQKVSMFGVNFANAIHSSLSKQHFQDIRAGKTYQSGWMSFSSLRQAQCVRVVVLDEKNVRVETLTMKPIYSGASVNSNIDYQIKHWLDLNGVTSQIVEATTVTEM